VTAAIKYRSPEHVTGKTFSRT